MRALWSASTPGLEMANGERRTLGHVDSYESWDVSELMRSIFLDSLESQIHVSG